MAVRQASSPRNQSCQEESKKLSTIGSCRGRKRRTQIPPKKEAGFVLWTILKNAIGKDLTRIPLPVDFNEPLSFIQRMTECMESSSLLTEAAKCSDPAMQMCHVAAFVLSSWSNSPYRLSKPFNALWGETYECDRMEDLGWRSIAEQVSHHPPIGAIKTEGTCWELEEDMQVVSQFQKTSIKVTPQGVSTLILNGNTTYTWAKGDIRTILRGFIMGPLTLHNEGDIIIFSETTQLKCHLHLSKQSSFFSTTSPENRQFHGKVMDGHGKKLIKVEGNWTSHFDVVDAKGNSTRLWTKTNIPTPDQEKFYNFSKFTVELNETEEGVAPTDSRNRPDMRLMENGEWDKANAEKARLEQKQREVMKKIMNGSDSVKYITERPVWFKKTVENGAVRYRYQGRYWDAKMKQDWSVCPEIYFKEK
ncbi:hypothetical protein L596_023785 [Steinernema carpocapsae]|uniref:Oxysterol-binding protein n=1 Tax=Steinernema carpocapsae TaxID=34508 RepID=A0A4U5MEP3_STECR|nr:hypothetical protein L596_023785 [Steinernema carpocapsae]